MKETDVFEEHLHESKIDLVEDEKPIKEENEEVSIYERNELKLDAKKLLEVNTSNSRQELPYQVNVFVGGVKSLGTQYRANAYGCQ